MRVMPMSKRWIAFAGGCMQEFASLAGERQLAIHGTEWFREEPVPMNDKLKGHMDDICGKTGDFLETND